MGSCSTLAFMSLAILAFQACYSYDMSDGSTFQFSRRHFESLRMQKRSVDAPSDEQVQCCGTYREPSDREKAIVKECSHFIRCASSTKSDEKAVSEVIDCFVLCVGTKLGMVKNGIVQSGPTKEHYREYFKEQKVNELSIKVIDHCLKSATQHFKDKSWTCNPILFVMADCHFRTMVMNCPKKYAVQSEKCEELRKEFERQMKKPEG